MGSRMFASTKRAALPAMLGFACALTVAPAAAQSVTVEAPTPSLTASPDDTAASQALPDTVPAAADDVVLGDALSFDPSSLPSTKPAKPLRLELPPPKGLDVTRSDNPDGSSTVKVKKPLPTDWDADVGADIGLAPTPMQTSQPDQPLPATTPNNPGSGAAWASIAVPNVASIDARVDQSSDQSKFGTTLKRALPIGSTLSLTLQESYSVTDNMTAPGTLPATAPLMMTLPASTTTPRPAPAQSWDNERLVKLDILPTGTSFAAGLDSVSTGPVTHNVFSADQKIYGALHMTTTVTDLGQPTESKSFTAGLKLSW
jgi:hypothetical protein